MKHSPSTPTLHLSAIALLLTSALFTGACCPCPPRTAADLHLDADPIEVEINGATLNFPQKEEGLPQVGRAPRATEVTLTFEFSGTQPGFKTLSLTDFRAYRESKGQGRGWFPDRIKVASGEISLDSDEMMALAHGRTVTERITLQVLSDGPLLIVPTAVLEVAPRPAGARGVERVPIAAVEAKLPKPDEIWVIDPPPIYIYP